jgi:hypothetical protein
MDKTERNHRINVLRKIDITFSTCLNDCQLRKEMNKKTNRGNQTRIDHHCSNVCPVGSKLQELGRHLINA